MTPTTKLRRLAAGLLVLLGLSLPLTAQDAAISDPQLDLLDLRAVPLSEACRILADSTGFNLAPSAEASTVTVSAFLRDLPATAAIDSLCRTHGLWNTRDPRTGIIRICTLKEYTRDLGSFQDDQVVYYTLLYPNAAEVGYAIRNLFGDRVSLRFGAADDDTRQDLEKRLERFDLIDSRTQGVGITSTNGTGNQSGTSGSSSGGSGSTTDESANSSSTTSVVPPPSPLTDAEAIRQLEDPRLDASQRAAVLDALTRRQQSPIQVTVVRRQNKVVVRSSDAKAMQHIRDLIKRLDVPTPQVLLEVRVMYVDIGDGFESFFEYQGAKNNVAGSFDTGSIVNPVPPALALGGTGLRSGDLIFQFVNDNFAARMQLLETKNRLQTIASPLLLTANNEVSRLFVGKEVPINQSFSGGQVSTNDSGTTTTPGTTDIRFVPVGTTLLLTPTINSDHTVTLRIIQEHSDIDSTATVLVPTSVGFTQETVNVVSAQTVSGTIIAKDQLAVAFGGLIEKGKVSEVAQVPLLGDIPYLGFFFRREVTKDTRREIMIVVRPYILSTPAESEAISQRLLSRLEVDTHAMGLDPYASDHHPTTPQTGAAVPYRIFGLVESESP